MKTRGKMGLMLLEDIFREQVEPRRKQELRDSEMAPEGRNSIANLSEKAVYRTFNPCEYVERLKNPANEKY